MRETPLLHRLPARGSGATHVHATLLERCKAGDRKIAAADAFAAFRTATKPQEKVRLRVREGYVTLEGRLDSFHQKDSLEAIVQHVPGVKGITNLIKTGF